MLPRMLPEVFLNRALLSMPKTHLPKASTPSKPNQVSKPKMSKIGKELTLSAMRMTKAREAEEKKREEEALAKKSSAIQPKIRQKQPVEASKAAPVVGVEIKETKDDASNRADTDDSNNNSHSQQQHSLKEALATLFMYRPWAAVVMLGCWTLWEKNEGRKTKQTDQNDRGDENGYGGRGPGGFPMALIPTHKPSSARQGRLKEWIDGEGKRREEEVMKEYGPIVAGKRFALLAEGLWPVVMLAMPGGFPAEGAAKGGSGAKEGDGDKNKASFCYLKGSVKPKSAVQQQEPDKNAKEQSKEAKDGDTKDSGATGTTAAQASENKESDYVVVEKEETIEEGYDAITEDVGGRGEALPSGKGWK